MFKFLHVICIVFAIGEANPITLNSTLLHWHPQPESVVREVQRRINKSVWRRSLLSGGRCETGNPIDDCWMCGSNWETNRQRLADCAIGFGVAAKGGKGGRVYVVTDSSDNPENPRPGTLRHGVIQHGPLWIEFSTSMTIVLKHKLIFGSYKTLDGRGANVSITGHGCLALQNVSHVIIHGINIYGCQPSGSSRVASSPSSAWWRGQSDGDGISIFGSQQVWIDHCTLSNCTDGLIDVIMGSTAITISNSYFSDHDQVMLLGHDDTHVPDKYMQVTIAFNYFGRGLTQRMPRCRHGYFHIVNNDYSPWKMYAIGGSANPTINSQGNRYTASSDPNLKEVTKRVDMNETRWSEWNWMSEGDVMQNGAFFRRSGRGSCQQYTDDNRLVARSAKYIVQLTSNAGAFETSRNGDMQRRGKDNGNDLGNALSVFCDGFFFHILIGLFNILFVAIL